LNHRRRHPPRRRRRRAPRQAGGRDRAGDRQPGEALPLLADLLGITPAAADAQAGTLEAPLTTQCVN